MRAPGIIVVLLLGIASLHAADKKSKSKTPDIEVVELSARRDNNLVTLDAKIRNCGEKPLKSITLTFRFFGTDRSPITTQRTTVEDDVLAPGESSEIHAQANDPVRAVSIEVSAVDQPGHDLNVAKSGPYPIE